MNVDQKYLTPLPNWDEQTCFGCGHKNDYGLRMKFYTDDLKVYSFLQIPTTMTGWGKTAHGGIVSTILDEIMGWTVIHLYKKLGVTKTMTVDFLKPITADEELTVVGSVEKKTGPRSAIIVGEIFNSSDTLCARSRGEFSLMDTRLAVRLGLVEKEYMETFGRFLGF